MIAAIDTRLALKNRREKILVVDDSSANRQLLKHLLRTHGFSVATAKNGAEAVDAVKKANPDLILMDVNMPIMNGYDATRKIKKIIQDRVVPIIFVTAMTDDHALANCLSAGGDDFVTFPLNEIIFIARVEAQLESRERTLSQQKRNQQLLEFDEMLAREQEISTTIFNAFMRRDALKVDHIKYQLSPMAVFNGDILLGATTPADDTLILIGDFTGHGLSAAIGGLPTSEIFSAMAAKGFGIGDIVAEINRRLKQLLPLGMFLVAAVIEVSERNNTLSIWSGGLPDILLLPHDSGVQSISANNVPLGILDSNEISTSVMTFPFHAGDRFYLYTDGVTEAENKSGDFFGQKRLKNTIRDAENEACAFQHTLDALTYFCDGYEQQDDLTFLEYVYFHPVDFANFVVRSLEHGDLQSDSDWKMELDMQPDVLKAFDPRPIVGELVSSVPGMVEYRERLLIILAELFSNALEHGVLVMDSSMKSSAEGFVSYYELKEQRLNKLTDGYVNLSLENFPKGKDVGELVISIEDSGSGFDIEKQQAMRTTPNVFSGRGIDLINGLCASVTISPPGNCCVAKMVWGKQKSVQE